MKAALRATAILASSSIVASLIGVVSAKVWATLVGPQGVGTLGLLQSQMGLGTLLGGVGLGTGIVRLGASALGRDALRELDALRTAADLLAWTLGLITALCFWIFRLPLSRWMLGGTELSTGAALMGVGVCFTLVGAVRIGTLNAHHRVATLARVSIVGSVLGAVLSVGVLWLRGSDGIPLAVLCPPLVGWLVALDATRRDIPRVQARPTRDEVRIAASQLFRFGVPFTLSSLVGSGVQMALPVLVLHYVGKEGVGFYRAATAISVGYLGLLLTAFAQDYYPRIAAATDERAVVELVNQQLSMITLISAPILVVAQVATPYLVPVLYSRSFIPAVPLLEWQWVGNLFRFWSWALAYLVLARSGSRTYFLIEFVGGSVTLVAGLVCLSWLGLVGLGVSFVVTYVVYSAVVLAIARRSFRLTISPPTAMLMVAALGVVLLVHSVPALLPSALRLPAGAVIAALTSGASLLMLWRVMNGRGVYATGE